MVKARRTILALLAALAAAMLALGGAASAQPQEGTTAAPHATAQAPAASEQLQVEESGGGNPGPLTEAQKLAISQGYLVPDQQAYERAKAEAQQKAARLSEQTTSTSAAARVKKPTTIRSWKGIRDPRWHPSDSTGAIGPTRYIELVNTEYAIYGRTGERPVSGGDLSQLIGVPSPAFITDPQVIWDATTHRFYYLALQLVSATDNRLDFGFSKTADPSSAADFCKYTIRIGSRYLDYPKLGDTQDLLLVGGNSYAATTFEYLGSDLVSITKPPAGSGCPARSEFTVDTQRSLQDATGGLAFTPVPANQIDTGEKGYVVAVPEQLFQTALARSLSVYEVKSGADGSLELGAPQKVPVPWFSFPPNAPQPNTRKHLDTLAAQNTQAILAKDPSRGGRLALWTQHTILGGSGAVVRWYEINPTASSLFQVGTVSGSVGVYAFNGAISPDRQVSGTSGSFGSNMVMGYNTSSTTRRPDIRMVSKRGDNPVSASVLIKSSSSTMADCERPVACRWGDYSGASPDPHLAKDARAGRVWLTNMWQKTPGVPGPIGEDRSGWSTWNWIAAP